MIYYTRVVNQRTLDMHVLFHRNTSNLSAQLYGYRISASMRPVTLKKPNQMTHLRRLSDKASGKVSLSEICKGM